VRFCDNLESAGSASTMRKENATAAE